MVSHTMRSAKPKLWRRVFCLLPRQKPVEIRAALNAVVTGFVVSSGVFFAAQADGSCGDWLVGHSDVVVADKKPQAPTDGVARAVDGTHDSHRPLKTPCERGSCGRAPSLPLVPTDAPTMTHDLERDAFMQLWSMPLTSSPRANFVVADTLFSATLADRLERPPRLG